MTPLTDHSLSILGKKIGTTRVSIYGEGKRLVGLFDVEVSYDISRLSVEIRRITGGGINVSSVNGRIMLSGSSHDAVTLDKAVVIARQFAPDIINTVQVLQPQQVMLEVRFVEASRAAGRELGVQWNSFGKNTLTNIGSRVEAGQLPVTTPGGPFQQPPYKFPPNQLGGKNIVDSTIPISSIVAAGVLSGTAPFGFLLGSMNRGALSIDVAINALEQKGLIRSLAEPNLVALSGDTASFLAGGEYPIPVPGGLGTVTIDYKKYGVGLAFTPTVLRDGLINLKIVPEVSELDISHPIQFLGYSIPPQADAGWIGEAGPGPSYLDDDSGGTDNDFTNRNLTFMTWNLLHLARMLKDAGGIPAHGNQRSGWDAGCRYGFENPEHR